MASFLENIEPFRGTGERNKDGQTGWTDTGRISGGVSAV